MKNKFKLLLPALIISSLLFRCNADKAPITLATYTYATNDRIENMRLLSEELENRLQHPVKMVSYPDVESFIAGIKSNEVDIALINTLGYLILSLDNEHMLPIANMSIEKKAIDNYKTVLLTTPNRIDDYSGIKGNAKTLAMMFVKKGSTSGNLVPRLFLNSLGINSPESQFKMVEYGGNHTSTFEKLVNGETDLCAIGSNEYYKQIEADSTLKYKTKLLWVSDEIPLGPVLISKKFSSKQKEVISNLFLSLHREKPTTFESIKSGWSEAKQAEKFQLLSDKYYDSFRELNGNRTGLKNVLDMFKD